MNKGSTGTFFGHKILGMCHCGRLSILGRVIKNGAPPPPRTPPLGPVPHPDPTVAHPLPTTCRWCPMPGRTLRSEQHGELAPEMVSSCGPPFPHQYTSEWPGGRQRQIGVTHHGLGPRRCTACSAHAMKPTQGGREETTLHLCRRHKGRHILGGWWPWPTAICCCMSVLEDGGCLLGT